MTYDWYREVPATEPVTQGDILDGCPVLVFRAEAAAAPDAEAIQATLAAASGVELARVVVMTQACDLLNDHVESVQLCPVFDLGTEYRTSWEAAMTAGGQKVTEKAWAKHLDQLKAGKIWNLTLLDRRQPPEGQAGIARGHLVVDFHEVMSIPLQFLRAWVTARGQARLQLCPPYREHLSQAFARYFMRVGLPVDIRL